MQLGWIMNSCSLHPRKGSTPLTSSHTGSSWAALSIRRLPSLPRSTSTGSIRKSKKASMSFHNRIWMRHRAYLPALLRMRRTQQQMGEEERVWRNLLHLRAERGTRCRRHPLGAFLCWMGIRSVYAINHGQWHVQCGCNRGLAGGVV